MATIVRVGVPEALHGTGRSDSTTRPTAAGPNPPPSYSFSLCTAGGSSTTGHRVLFRYWPRCQLAEETGLDLSYFFPPPAAGSPVTNLPLRSMIYDHDYMHSYRDGEQPEAAEWDDIVVGTECRCHTRHQASRQRGHDHRHDFTVTEMERRRWIIRHGTSLSCVMIGSNGSGSNSGPDPPLQNIMICCLGHPGSRLDTMWPARQAEKFKTPSRPGILSCHLRSHTQAVPRSPQTESGQNASWARPVSGTSTHNSYPLPRALHRSVAEAVLLLLYSLAAWLILVYCPLVVLYQAFWLSLKGVKQSVICSLRLLFLWCRLSRRKKWCLLLALSLLSGQCFAAHGVTPARKRFSMRIKLFRRCRRDPHKIQKRRRVTRAKSTARTATAKRHDNHYDQAGGVSSSCLVCKVRRLAIFAEEQRHSESRAARDGAAAVIPPPAADARV